MKLLFLGYDKLNTSLIDKLEKAGASILQTSEKLTPAIFSASWELVVSFGYRHILKREDFEMLAAPVLNLHISYLPRFRGDHPNFWAHYFSFCLRHFANNTPPPEK
jgi:methionyl-tRNA formyltransferase